MSATASLQDQDPSLGLIGRLPQELRDKIYILALPEGFQQVFQVNRRRQPPAALLDRDHAAYRHAMFAGHYVRPDYTPEVAYKRDRSSKPLSILYLSKKLQKEAAFMILKGYACKVEVGVRSYKTNFPLYDPILPAYYFNNVLKLTMAQGIQVSVAKPEGDTVVNRQAVQGCLQQVVDMLNGFYCSLPAIQASLVNWHGSGPPYNGDDVQIYWGVEACSCNENDYAMLLGPLMKLEQAVFGVSISCTSPPVSNAALLAVLAQIDAMETAMRGPENRARYLLDRQTRIDIKYTLAIHVRHDKRGPSKDATPIPIDGKTARKLLSVIKEMVKSRSLLMSRGNWVAILPAWMYKLEAILRTPGKKVVDPKLQTAVFGGRSVDKILIWGAKGKGPNPIY